MNNQMLHKYNIVKRLPIILDINGEINTIPQYQRNNGINANMIFGNRTLIKIYFFLMGNSNIFEKENKNSEFLLISYHNSFFAFFGNQIACNISCTKI